MIVVIGAGITGLMSALTMKNLGHKVMVIDKGTSVGGRMATRYLDKDGHRRYIDTAARCVTLSEETPRFNELMRAQFPDHCASNRCYGPSGLNSICKHLVSTLKGVDILMDCKATAIDFNQVHGRFNVHTISG